MKSFFRNVVEATVNECGGNAERGRGEAAHRVARALEREIGTPGALTQAERDSLKIDDVFEVLCNPDGNLDMNNWYAVNEAVTASAFPTVTSALISSFFMPEYNYALGNVEQLVTNVPSDHRTETIVGFGATDPLEVVGEEQPYSGTTVSEKYVTIKNLKFGREVNVTRELVTFDKTNQIARRAKNIGEKAGLLKHEIIVSKATMVACTPTGEVANACFNFMGTATAVFQNDHSAVDGQVNDNIDTTAFGHDALVALNTLRASIVDEKGDRLVYMPKQLLVPVALEVAAEQLLGGTNEYDTANLNINPFKNKYQLVVSPFLDANSALYYYLGNFPKGLVWTEVWPTQVTQGPGNFRNDTIMETKVGFYGGCGYADYRFVARGGA